MWQYGIDQWVGQNEFLYGKTKEERLAKTTQEVDSQIRHMHRTDSNTVNVSQRIYALFGSSYEAWATLSDSQITSQRQVAPLWNQASGRRPRVRLRQEN